MEAVRAGLAFIAKQLGLPFVVPEASVGAPVARLGAPAKEKAPALLPYYVLALVNLQQHPSAVAIFGAIAALDHLSGWGALSAPAAQQGPGGAGGARGCFPLREGQAQAPWEAC